MANARKNGIPKRGYRLLHETISSQRELAGVAPIPKRRAIKSADLIQYIAHRKQVKQVAAKKGWGVGTGLVWSPPGLKPTGEQLAARELHRRRSKKQKLKRMHK